MIPQSFIQDLLNRVDIVDVIERYVHLKKAGANYVACCPFHSEKSPSFTVSPSKQFYHCFGCGAHGTVIGFVMEHAGLGFVEAVEELARSVGMTVPRETAATQIQSKAAPDLYELMQTATRYYRDCLKQSPRAIEYLKGRGLSGEIAARFGIGYAPDGWQNLAAIVPDYQHKSLVETGLVIVSEEGDKRYDRFRDRIMFPIVNSRGQVIGFGGRVLDKGEPKYLNSPETSLFEKGRELYGLFQAQKAIRASHTVLVVEGYMDVVALAQHGIEYAVATLGTATTPYHVQKLLRLTDHVVFSFDGDAAGRKAAWRALENALPQLVDGKRVGFLFLPPEHDPDSYVREYGKEAFERVLNEALPLSGYMLRELSSQVDLRTQEGKTQLINRAQPLLTAIAAPATALLLRKEIAALAGVTQSELEGLYGMKPVGSPVRPAPAKAAKTGFSSARKLLRYLLASPSLAGSLPDEFYAAGQEYQAVKALVEYLRETGSVSTAVIIQHFQGTPFEGILAQAESDIMSWGEGFDVASEFEGLLAKQRDLERRHQLEELNAKMSAGGGLKALNDEEKALYARLTRASTKI
jgi:DNA primase